MLPPMLALLVGSALYQTVQTATVTQDLHLTWETGAPNGQSREMIFTNGEFPGPTLWFDEDDDVEITVHNGMSRNATVHYHGLSMPGTPWSDGVIGLGQRPILPGDSYTYRFKATPAGTHWYHSHEQMSQYDGLYGAIFIRPKQDLTDLWAKISSDEADIRAMNEAAANPELLLLSDWSRLTSDEYWAVNLDSKLLIFCADSVMLNGHGAVFCPPQDLLINQTVPGIAATAFTNGEHVNDKGCFPFTEPLDGPWVTDGDESKIPWGMNEGCVPSEGSNATIEVDPAKGWVSLNFISAAISKQPYFSLDEHWLWIYEVDGNYVEPARFVAAAISPGERFSAMVKLDQAPGTYTLRIPDSGFTQVISGFADVVYKGAENVTRPSQPYISYGGRPGDVALLHSYNTYNLTTDHMPPWPAAVPHTGDADDEFLLVVGRMNGTVQYTANTRYLYPAYFAADTPLLYYPDQDRGPAGDGLVLRTKNGSWVDLIVQVSTLYGDEAAGEHVFHKHGSKTWRIGQGRGVWNYSSVAEAIAARPEDFNLVNPGYRDTWMTAFSPVPVGGYWSVHRYFVDNPGPWLYHCHFELHLAAGMAIAILDGVDAWPEVPPEYALSF